MRHQQPDRRGQRSSTRRFGQATRNFDSNGPGGRVRGAATQIAEKYEMMARDAIGTGDRVLAETLLQFAEHYRRVDLALRGEPTSSDTDLADLSNSDANGADDMRGQAHDGSRGDGMGNDEDAKGNYRRGRVGSDGQRRLTRRTEMSSSEQSRLLASNGEDVGERRPRRSAVRGDRQSRESVERASGRRRTVSNNGLRGGDDEHEGDRLIN